MGVDIPRVDVQWWLGLSNADILVLGRTFPGELPRADAVIAGVDVPGQDILERARALLEKMSPGGLDISGAYIPVWALEFPLRMLVDMSVWGQSQHKYRLMHTYRHQHRHRHMHMHMHMHKHMHKHKHKHKHTHKYTHKYYHRHKHKH